MMLEICCSNQPTTSLSLFRNHIHQGLHSCSTINEVKQFHSQIIRLGLSSDNDTMGRVIKLCAPRDALKLFDNMPHPDTFIYNTIFRAFLQFHLINQCFSLYLQMLHSYVTPNHYTFPPLIRASSDRQLGKQLHAHIFKFGFHSDTFCQNNLIHMYLTFKSLEEARRVFDKMHNQDVVSWTTLITGYSQSHEARQLFDSMPHNNPATWNAMIAAYVQTNHFQEAFRLFDDKTMFVVATTAPSPVTSNHHRRLVQILKQCKSMSHLKQIHAHTLRTTSTSHPHTLFLHSQILHFVSLHDLPYAFLFFYTHIQNPNSFAWNTIIRACSRSINPTQKQLAILLYLQMLSHVSPDNHTFPFVLKACAYLFALSEGKQLHAHILKLGLAADVYINNSLIHFYGSCGRLHDARHVFDEMPETSVVSWNVMIDTLVQLNEFDDALICFREMQQSFKPDGFAIQSILRACAGLGALSLGMWAHAYLLRKCNPEVSHDVLVNNCLLDMYWKCGSLETSKLVFKRMVKRDLTSWNTMILGFATHGQALAALEYFRQMIDEEGLMPNSITFSGVLSACRHSGMVNEARNYFNIMTTKYGIEPVLEHYGCLVDLLARVGLITEALDAVSNMHIKPDVVIWRSILDACSKGTTGIDVSEEMAKKIMESEQGSSNLSGVYMLLSRVYALTRKWNEVGSVRKLMTDKGVAKEPGCSAIEINGVTHEFFAGDTSLAQI